MCECIYTCVGKGVCTPVCMSRPEEAVGCSLSLSTCSCEADFLPESGAHIFSPELEASLPQCSPCLPQPWSCSRMHLCGTLTCCHRYWSSDSGLSLLFQSMYMLCNLPSCDGIHSHANLSPLASSLSVILPLAHCIQPKESKYMGDSGLATHCCDEGPSR